MLSVVAVELVEGRRVSATFVGISFTAEGFYYGCLVPF